MEIKIEFLPNTDTGNMFCGWKVSHGDKYVDGLGYDEMLGLIAAITMPEERPTLQWLMTEEQHLARRKRFEDISDLK